jgi:AraC-like DNA-binding protein
MLGDGLRVSQIGEKTGFASASYFSSCFKNEFGISAKQYEQQLSTNTR